MDQPLKVGCYRGCEWEQGAGDREAVGAQGHCWQSTSREGRGAGQRKYTGRKYQVWTQEGKTEVFCAGMSLARQAEALTQRVAGALPWGARQRAPETRDKTTQEGNGHESGEDTIWRDSTTDSSQRGRPLHWSAVVALSDEALVFLKPPILYDLLSFQKAMHYLPAEWGYIISGGILYV